MTAELVKIFSAPQFYLLLALTLVIIGLLYWLMKRRTIRWEWWSWRYSVHWGWWVTFSLVLAILLQVSMHGQLHLLLAYRYFLPVLLAACLSAYLLSTDGKGTLAKYGLFFFYLWLFCQIWTDDGFTSALAFMLVAVLILPFLLVWFLFI
jgi:hypothetical protein